MSHWKSLIIVGVLVIAAGAEMLKSSKTDSIQSDQPQAVSLAKNIALEMGYDQAIIIDPEEPVAVKENAVAQNLRKKAKAFKFKKKKRKSWVPDAARLSKADFKHGKKVKSKDKKKKKKKRIAKKKKRVKRKTKKREKKVAQKPVPTLPVAKKETSTTNNEENNNQATAAPAQPIINNQTAAVRRRNNQLKNRSADEWFKIVSTPRPSRSKVDGLIQNFRSKVVTEKTFYEVAKKMTQDQNIDLQLLAVRMYGIVPTDEGYIGLASIISEGNFATAVVVEADKFRKEYRAVKNIEVLNQVLSNFAASDAVKIRAVEDIRQSANENIGQGQISILSENNTFKDPNAQKYFDFLATIENIEFGIDDEALKLEIADLKILLNNLLGQNGKLTALNE